MVPGLEPLQSESESESSYSITQKKKKNFYTEGISNACLCLSVPIPFKEGSEGLWSLPSSRNDQELKLEMNIKSI